jgi:hypothetical protein
VTGNLGKFRCESFCVVPAAPATVEIVETLGSGPPENGVPRPELRPPLKLGDPRPETLALMGTVSLKLS